MPNNRPVVANLDFADIKQDLIDYFKNYTDENGVKPFEDYEFTGSSLNILMDILAYNTHYNALTSNFLLNEMFLDSAVLRSNVVSLAKSLNYIPRSASASRSDITLNIKRSGTESFHTVPAGSNFTASSGSTSYNFYTVDDHTVQFEGNDSENDLVITAFEGSRVTQTFTVTGEQGSFPSFDLLNDNIDTDTIVVSVNSVKYNKVTPEEEGISGFNKLSRIFFVEETSDGVHRILLGNGEIGVRPDNGTVVTVSYLITGGSGANGIKRFTIVDDAGGLRSIKSSETSQGGAPRETIRSIKDNAPHWYRSQYRAVTEQDYRTILLRKYSDIQSINVYGGERVGQPGKVFFAIKPKSAPTLTDSAKETIKADILDRFNVVSITPVIVDPLFIKVVMNTVIQYDNTLLTSTTGAIRAQTIELFNTLNTEYIGEFLKNFRNSQVLAQIRELDDSIVSVNNRISLSGTITSEDGTLANSTINFGNRLFHPTEGYLGETGGILSSTFFKRAGNIFQSALDDDGLGNIRLFTIQGEEKIYSGNVGTIDYDLGIVRLENLIIEDGSFDITVVPDSFDVSPLDNYILEIDANKSIVRVVEQDQRDLLRSINSNRST